MTKKDYAYAIKTIDQTADYYHSMILEKDDVYWMNAYETALDLLERVQDLPEDSLIIAHRENCEECHSLTCDECGVC